MQSHLDLLLLDEVGIHKSETKNIFFMHTFEK